MEEAVLKKQVKAMGMDIAPLEEGTQLYPSIDDSIPLSALEALVFANGEAEFKEAAAALAQEGNLDDVGLEDDDDEAASSMRQILQEELGGNYREAVEAEMMQR